MNLQTQKTYRKWWGHSITGFVVFILATAAMIVVLISKPSFRPVQGISIILVVLLTIQIILGFDTLKTNSSAIAWVHFVNAMMIYGASIASVFFSMRRDLIVKGAQAPAQM